MASRPESLARDMTLAVTGASGYIAQRLLDRLVSEGRPAVALSRRGSGLAVAHDVIVRDYADGSALVEALKGVDCLIHLAARAHAPAVAGEAELFRRANVECTLAVAAACLAAGVKRFILVSSIGVNGDHSIDGRPFSADDEPRPAEPYAVSKLEAERALSTLLTGRPLEYVIVRPPLVYGPGCPGNFAKLMRFVRRAPIVPLGGLNAPRSLIYVDNLVDALLVAARSPGLAGRTFLLSDGHDLSVAEIARELASAMQRPPSVVRAVPAWLLAFAARLAGRRETFNKLASALQVDAGAFVRATGWQAPISPSEGLRAAARQSSLP